MAASVYATPPPDLSGEDTALSDVSNSSQISSTSSQQSKAAKRNITSVLLGGSTLKQTSVTTTSSRTSSTSSNSPIDSLDQSKKRRKQTTPIRISGSNLNIEQNIDVNVNNDAAHPILASDSTTTITESIDDEKSTKCEIQMEQIRNNENIQNKIENEIENNSVNSKSIENSEKPNNEEVNNKQKENIEILTNRLLDPKNISNKQLDTIQENQQKSSPSLDDKISQVSSNDKIVADFKQEQDIENFHRPEVGELLFDGRIEAHKGADSKFINNDDKTTLKSCEQCNEKFDSELKLSVHILQIHAMPKVHIIPKNQMQEKVNTFTNNDQNGTDSQNGLEIIPVQVKLERSDSGSDSDNGNINNNKASSTTIGNNNNNNSSMPPRPEEWLTSMSGLGFPFPPEAAAAISASNYLSQLPLLGVPPVGPYNPVEGLSRPPLRIFNPEAYCDLCNKEFCNKYFLKTHKANKHGIYDPVTSSNDSTTTNQFNQISQVLQMQFQQQQQHQQAQQQHIEHQQQKQLQHQQVQSQIPQPSLPQLQTQSQQSQQGPPSQSGGGGVGGGVPPSSTSSSSSSSQTLMPPEISVFCEICNKRFTNIFAMKRHRSKAHEIPPPINSPTTTSTSNQIKSEVGNQQQNSQQQQQQQQPPSSSQSSSLLLQQQQQQQQQQHNQQLIQNEKDISSSTQQLLRIPEGFREDFTLEQEDVSFTPQPRKLSPSSSQQAREANFSFDKLKRLGVINPEAFCDLCCKEYCNKYFLRTHKLKRHGIFIPADDGIIGSTNNSKDEKMPSWPFVQQMQQQMQQMQMHMHQATPLNLMMAAAAAGVANADKISRRLSEDSDDDEIGIVNERTFKKIRLDSSNNDDEKRLRINGPSNSSKQDDHSEHELSNSKSLEISENFNQMMQEGLANAAAAGSCQDPEAISIDLQKLQSMILQLNDLNGQRPMACNICGKEVENQFHLQAHLATEHAGIGNDNNSLRGSLDGGGISFKSQFQLSSRQSSPTNSNTTEICKQCDKEFPGLLELKQHIIEYHGLLLNSPVRDGFITPERSMAGGCLTAPGTPNQLDRKPLYTVTPTSSYCEICNKELCNKYFMKTHMQRMHGIEIENGAQIGGVVCNICNKELCSKYFLRVHKTNSHGIVDEGSPIPAPPSKQFDEAAKNIFEALENKSDLNDLGARYFTHYTEVCPLCNRRFRSSKWLRAHLMSDHGKAGVEKLHELAQTMIFSKPDSPTLKIPNGNGNVSGGNITPGNTSGMGGLNNIDPSLLVKNPFPGLFMKNDDTSVSAVNSQRFQEYQCSLCPFSTPYYAFLFIHERSHSILNTNTSGQLEDHQTNMMKSETPASIYKDDRDISPHSHDHTKDHKIAEKHHQIDSMDRGEQLLQQPTKQLKQKSSSLAGTSPISTPISTPIPQTTSSEIIGHNTKLDIPSIPNFNTLNHLANLLNRPASYAIPQNFEGEIMQSFLIEEKSKTSEQNKKDNDSNNKGENLNRFVPAVIFLPVRERISGPITVSFTLTPA